MTVADFKKGGRFQVPDDYYHYTQIIPVIEGCKLKLRIEDPESDNEDSKEIEIGLPELMAGLKLMAEKSPRHFRDFIEENDDVNTADTFGQYVVYQEEVFC